ncbi:MAG: hypothetical protein IPJ32_20290 [Sphingobacteriaceae bacterium]|nr:hypothetical protein [Sphingobacteriaceae bacterium]
MPVTISQMENLALLDVRGCAFSKEYVDEIKAMLPGCDVKFDLPKEQPK